MKNYTELSEQEKLSYDHLLKTTEWDVLRKRLFAESNNKCSECNKQAPKDGQSRIYTNPEFVKQLELDGKTLPSFFYPTILHLHHKYYVRNTLPWDYPDSCFKVVCGDCHSKIHKEQTILVYPNSTMSQSENLTPCNRCDGLGYLSHYYYVSNGVCFKCGGAGFEELKQFDHATQNNLNNRDNQIRPPLSATNEDDLPF